MPIIESAFLPPRHLRNKHLQTLWPSLMRKPAIPPRNSHTMNTHDGDEILLETVIPETESSQALQQNNQKAVLLIHGLTGSADSQYIVGLQNFFRSTGIFSIAMNFRGAKTPNKLASGYHSGSSSDIAEIVKYLHKNYPQYQWQAMGFSLGGNVLLKYLGENPDSPLTQAFAVSVPLSLDVCATQLDQGFSKVYRNHLLSQLGQYLNKKHLHLQNINHEQAERLLQTPIHKKFSSFWDFDHEIIAPLHGFTSVNDYYQRCSSRQFLKHIQTPTHILNALDDPFLSPELIPDASELSAQVTLELSAHGGHVGFFSGKNNYYAEVLARKFMQENP